MNGEDIMKRCIMIVPKFDNREIIDSIRKKYDPTESFLEAHITLVFPFESVIDDDTIETHVIKTTAKIEPFEVVLQGIKSDKSFDNCIFLEVVKGIEELTKLHNNLYAGILEQYMPKWLDDIKFIPHMTVGKFQSKDELDRAITELKNIKDVFRSKVSEIEVEIIGEKSSSIIENTIKLGGR